MDIAGIKRLLNSSNILVFIRNNEKEGVKFNVPVKFKCVRTTSSQVEEVPFRFSYTSAPRSFRKDFGMKVMNLYIASVNSLDLDFKRDTILGNLPLMTTFALDYPIYETILMNMQDWIRSLFSTTGQVYCIRLPQFEVISFFDMAKVS